MTKPCLGSCRHEPSRIVFGRDAFPADKNCKALLNTEFSVKKDQYIELGGNNKTAEIIWNLINKGYPVYFVSEGHIETGFPDGYAYTSYRYRYEDDIRYDEGKHQKDSDKNTLYEAMESSSKLVVGAGTSVGFKKNWDGNYWLNTESRVYLYLNYLKNKY